MVGDTIADYLRERRLTQAACELVTTDRRILDIALDYRCESHEAFTRTFRRHHSTMPREFRTHGEFQVLRDRAVVAPPGRESCHMTSGPEIVRASPRLAIGVELRVSTRDRGNLMAIQEF